MKIHKEKLVREEVTRQSDQKKVKVDNGDGRATAEQIEEVNRQTIQEKTVEEFSRLQLIESPFRIKGLYSYRLFDHPDYIMCMKIERKLQKFEHARWKQKEAKRQDSLKSGEL